MSKIKEINMTIYYVAGKITGDDNYKEKFKKACESIQKVVGECDWVINPVEECERDGKLYWLEFMCVCKGLIDMADEIILLPDWDQSFGAKAEVEYAKNKLNMKIHKIKDFLKDK